MKKLALILILLYASASVDAQEKPKREFLLFGATGISTLKYDVQGGSQKSGFGGAIGLRYNHYLTENWSLGAGLEMSFNNSKVVLNNHSDAYQSNDGQYDFEFRTTVSNYEEKQNVSFLNIPIIAQFQIPALQKSEFYIGGGVKLGLPLGQKFEIGKATMQNSGFYSNWSGEQDLVLDAPNFMGFGTFNRKTIKGDLDFKMAYSLSLETGLKWKSGEKGAIYTGVYVDYGLNDINNGERKNLVEYNETDPENFTNNSVIKSTLVSKVSPLAIGVKLSYAFGGKKKD